MQRLVLVTALTVAGCGSAAPPAPRAPAAAGAGAAAVEVRFLERDGRDKPWRPITEPARLASLRAMLEPETARLALDLYALAWEIAPPPELPRPVLFLGVEEGGNHVAVGVELADGTRYPELPYVRIEADARTFAGTLLHEGGHALHSLLARGGTATAEDGVIAPIPHSTAAVTDRRTALNEGFAIHLEAVNGHCGRDAATRAFYDHDPALHGPTGDASSEYYFAVRDPMSYAHDFARYQMVRDGLYAFETAARGDYLRVQLDSARDLRTLRDPGSMVASEGFVASVLFHTVLADGCRSLPARYRRLFEALRAAETSTGPLDPVPLLDLVAAIGEPAIDAFLDLSRGATVDGAAAARWARLYDAAIAVDVATRKALIAEIEPVRRRWRDDALADPRILARRIGPVVPIVVPGLKVGIAAFGPLHPLSFDANAAGAPLLSLIPRWTARDVAAYLAERERAPFASAADVMARVRAPGLAAP